MSLRQVKRPITLLALLLLIAACSPQATPLSPPTASTTPPATPTVSPSPIPPSPTATATPITCLSQPGTIQEGEVTTTTPPQKYLIYLPPCYQELTHLQYPTLYLLHGQTYTQDQWVRLGITRTADKLIHSGESVPFLIILPDDRYWNVQAGPGFGDRFINALIPFIDEQYRTRPTREYRALGGLSRGGGWAIQLGFEYPNLFGSIGLHSPAIFREDAPSLTRMLKNIPVEARPRLWIDTGDADSGLESILEFETLLTKNQYLHQFQQYTGYHTEEYWSAHVEEYLQWYIAPWNNTPNE